MAKQPDMSVADTLVISESSTHIRATTGSELDDPTSRRAREPGSLAPPSLEGPAVFAGRYEVRALLGSGGMGAVYAAFDRELDELVALKLLRHEIVGQPGMLELFRREVKTARKVTHPNVARVFDIGEHEGARFLTMELVDGPSLARVLEQSGPLAVPRAIEIATAVCAGLQAAHEASVVHRDLKPDNVLVDRAGRVVITDFGIARPLAPSNVAMTAGIAIGTPAYMSPEQVEARRDLDARVDLYALGAMLFELLTGQLPFRGASALAVAAARLAYPAPDPRTLRPELPSALAELVLRCLEREREQRYGSAEEVARALSRITMSSLPALSAPARPAALPQAAKSLAVLPVRSGDAQQALMADGLWDDLVDALSMTAGLRVRPRMTVARVSSSERDPLEIGRALDVDVILEASIRAGGSGPVVTTRLSSVRDGFQLWAGRFPATHDLFALTDAIASEVASALTVEARGPARRAPTDPLAMSDYLRGRALLRDNPATGVADGVALLAKALERAPDEPTFLAAYAAGNVRLWFIGGEEGELARDRATHAAERALVLAPHLVEARHALAVLRLHSGDVGSALVTLRSIVAEVDFAPSLEILGGLLAELDELDEGRRMLELSLRIDPQSRLATYDLARLAALDGRWETANLLLDQLDRSVGGQLDVGMARLRARFAFWQRRSDAFDPLIGSGAAFGPISGELLTRLAEKDRAGVKTGFEADRQTGGSRRRDSLVAQLQAEAGGMMDDLEWALAGVERAVASGFIDLAWLRRCPLLDRLRDQPRFLEQERALEQRARELVRVYRAAA